MAPSLVSSDAGLTVLNTILAVVKLASAIIALWLALKKLDRAEDTVE